MLEQSSSLRQLHGMTRHKKPKIPSAAPTSDTRDRDLTGYVGQFIQNFVAMVRDFDLEPLDLRTQEGALNAVRLLERTCKALEAQQRVAGALTTLLAERRRDARGFADEASCRSAVSKSEEDLPH